MSSTRFARARSPVRGTLWDHAEALEAGGAVRARRSRRLLSLRDTARAMSQENVEVVRASIDAWNRGDLDAAAEH